MKWRPPPTFRLVGRDWCNVFETEAPGPCRICGDVTHLILSFKPGSTVRICGKCRGY